MLHFLLFFLKLRLLYGNLDTKTKMAPYKFSEEQAQNYILSSSLQASRNFIRSLINPNDTVIDLACGPGIDSNRYVKPDSYVGIDISLDLLKLAKKNRPFVSYIQADLQFLPIKSKSVDYSYIKSTLEHTFNLSEALFYISEAIRISKKDVFIVWHTPPLKSKIFYQKNVVFGHDGKPVNQNTYPEWVFALFFKYDKTNLEPHQIWRITYAR